MKKLFVLSLFVFYCLSSTLIADEPAVSQTNEKLAAMDSFFKIQWGVSGQEFKTKFKEVQPKEKLIRASTGFDVYLFQLGEIRLMQLKFLFRTKEGKEIKMKKNLDKTFFYKVMFDFEPKDFSKMVEIFKMKYGNPTSVETSELQNNFGAKFEQQILIWINPQLKRSIVLKRYTSRVDQSIAIFAPLGEGGEKKEVKSAADIL